MKALIIIFAAIILASCSEFQCPSYGGTNGTTKHGKKAQSHYAKHNKSHKSLF